VHEVGEQVSEYCLRVFAEIVDLARDPREADDCAGAEAGSVRISKFRESSRPTTPQFPSHDVLYFRTRSEQMQSTLSL
jgi:hypothetical protein